MKNLILIIIMGLLTFNALSQTSKKADSTLIPNRQLIIALQKIESGDHAKRELAFTREANSILLDRVAVKDSLISGYIVLKERQQNLIENYKLSEGNLIAQNTTFSKEVKRLNKKLKAQKTKTFIGSLAGLAGMITLILLK